MTAQHVGQLLMVGFDGTSVPTELRDRIGRGDIGGVILFSRNFIDVKQIAELTQALRDAAPAGLPLLIGVDQEGGRVQRIRAPLPFWPPMRELGKIDDVVRTEAIAIEMGQALRDLGFNLNFAPVCDVVQSDVNTVIGDRSFGSDAELVSRHVVAFANGLARAGILACGKHFPGHGGPVSDSHTSVPTETRREDELRRIDLVPFQRLAAVGVPMMMTAHVYYKAYDAEHLATISHRICHGILREELRYDGVLISDDLDMAAVSSQKSIDETVDAAVSAGVDMLLVGRSESTWQRAAEILRQIQHDNPERLTAALSRVAQLKHQLTSLQLR